MNPRRQRLALLLALMLANASTPATPTQSGQNPNPAVVEQQIRTLGAGQEVLVKLVSGQTLRGCIVDAGDSSFGLSSNCTGPYRLLAYAGVSRVRVRKQRGLLPWVMGGVVVAAVVVVAIVHKPPHHLVVH